MFWSEFVKILNAPSKIDAAVFCMNCTAGQGPGWARGSIVNKLQTLKVSPHLSLSCEASCHRRRGHSSVWGTFRNSSISSRCVDGTCGSHSMSRPWQSWEDVLHSAVPAPRVSDPAVHSPRELLMFPCRWSQVGAARAPWMFCMPPQAQSCPQEQPGAGTWQHHHSPAQELGWMGVCRRTVAFGKGLAGEGSCGCWRRAGRLLWDCSGSSWQCRGSKDEGMEIL